MKLTTKSLSAIALLASTTLNHTATAAEQRWVAVDRVEPITHTVRMPVNDPRCTAGKPRRSAGLSALLSWDVGVDCAPKTRQRVSEYRVFYTWQDRQYSYLSRTLPEHKIRLRVDVDPI
ncbi:MAG: hypothetical protein AAF529_18305 [Pseudomonadota bacterium]